MPTLKNKKTGKKVTLKKKNIFKPSKTKKYPKGTKKARYGAYA